MKGSMEDRCKACGKRYPREVREALREPAWLSLTDQEIRDHGGRPRADDYAEPPSRKALKKPSLYAYIPKDNALEKRWGMAMKLRRNELGLSQGAVAEKLGVSTMTISYWEKGERPITVDTLCGIANALDIEASELFRFEGQ